MNRKNNNSVTANANGLTHAWLLDGQGGGQSLDWNQLDDSATSAGQWRWLHLDYSNNRVQQWMHSNSGLSQLTVEALLQTETRPRCEPADGGMMIFLRGVNLNPGADPEDMVSLRVWLGENRIYSFGLRRLLSVDDMHDSIKTVTGPASPGDFLVMLIERLLDRASRVIEDVYDLVDALEDTVLVASNYLLQREQLATIRRQAIALRRFLAPQREALNRLSAERSPVLTDQHRLQIREQSDRLTRLIEDIDAARERASVTHESLLSRVAEQTNQRMYILSIVAAIFLPLSFATGLLGVNVGGIPGASNDFGFLVVVVLMLLIAAVLWAFFRWRGWF